MNTGDTARERRAFPLALAALVVVAAVDIAVGSEAVLAELLVAGPLIAATGATPRQTLAVTILALVIAVPIGVASDAFSSGSHLMGIGVIAIGGLLAVIIARLRAARERDSARLQVQYGVARAIGEATSFDEAAPPLLAAIARPLGREVAQFWSKGRRRRCCTASPTGERPASTWRPSSARAASSRCRPGRGCPDRRGMTGRPVWFGDALAAGNFLRTREAEEADLHGGLAFPVTGGAETIGVIELFSHAVRERDPEIYALTEALGRQVGEFIESLRAEEAVRVSEARMRAVLDSALDAVITMDHEGRVVEFNRAAEQLFGHPEDAALGQEMAELVIPPSLRERHREGLRRYLETGESRILGRRIELTGMRAGRRGVPGGAGRERDRRLGPADVHRHDPRHRRLRREDEKAREEARAQLEAILRGVADAVTAQAPDGRLLFANDAAATSLGFDSPAELMSAPIATILDRFDILQEDGRPFPLEALPGRRALSGEEGAESLVRFRVP